jgi:hypothetical protein
MDKKPDAKGETAREAGDHGAGADPATADTIEATGDAIIVSAAIHDLADSFREMSAAIRSMIPSGEEDGENTTPERYLDGSPIKK